MTFTYYTIIGKDINLLKGHINNVKNYAGFDNLPCNKELIVIVYKNPKISDEVTQSILDFCSLSNIRTHIYNEPDSNFLTNLYHCWNLGYELAADGYVFRGGSDQVFSKNSFIELYEQAEKLRESNIKSILQANTIENAQRLRTMGIHSRHFMENFGNDFNDFNYGEFESFIERINSNVNLDILNIEQCLAIWKKPTGFHSSIGYINRTDGCSWLMTKEDWKLHGPLPALESGITGDVIIHDRMQRAGYNNFIVKNCITYHFVKGESHK